MVRRKLTVVSVSRNKHKQYNSTVVQIWAYITKECQGLAEAGGKFQPLFAT